MERIGDIGVFRLEGESRQDLAAKQVADAIRSALEGRLVLAMVTHPDLIDPQRFGVVAAANFGLEGNVFTSEELALAWLEEQP